MTVEFELPVPIADALRQQFGNLDQAAKEAAMVEFYRQGRLTHHQMAQALGVSRFEVDAVLKRHKVMVDLMTFDELFQPVPEVSGSPSQ